MRDPELEQELRQLGNAACALRLRLVLPQEEIGRRSGIHRNYIGAIERGEVNATYETLLRLAAGLDVPLERLIADAASDPQPIRRLGRPRASRA